MVGERYPFVKAGEGQQGRLESLSTSFGQVDSMEPGEKQVWAPDRDPANNKGGDESQVIRSRQTEEGELTEGW